MLNAAKKTPYIGAFLFATQMRKCSPFLTNQSSGFLKTQINDLLIGGKKYFFFFSFLRQTLLPFQLN